MDSTRGLSIKKPFSEPCQTCKMKRFAKKVNSFSHYLFCKTLRLRQLTRFLIHLCISIFWSTSRSLFVIFLYLFFVLITPRVSHIVQFSSWIMPLVSTVNVFHLSELYVSGIMNNSYFYSCNHFNSWISVYKFQAIC